MVDSIPMPEMVVLEDAKEYCKEPLYYRRWNPPSHLTKVGTLLIVHGMAEHSARYHPVACNLANQGYVVFADDHRGHGKTGSETILGHHEEGLSLIKKDEITFLKAIKKEFPDLPQFLFGHSMGSLVSANVAVEYTVDGLILSGCPNPNAAGVTVYGVLLEMLIKMRGPNAISYVPDTFVFNKWNAQFTPPKGKAKEHLWVVENEASRDKYNADDWCGFKVSLRFHRDCTTFMRAFRESDLYKNEFLKTKTFLLGGNYDPCVGFRGDSLFFIADTIQKGCGVRPKVSVYPGRHEVLNEDKEIADQLVGDISNFLNLRVQELKAKL